MIIYNCALFASMIIIIYLISYVLVKSDSTKRIWYLAALACVFLFLLGELLGKLSTTAEGAFMGTKVEYIGSASLTPAILLFVADFCGIKIHRLFKALLWVIPFAVIILLWTTASHGLIYSVFDFTQDTGVQRLRITAGPLHLVVHIYSLICTLLSISLLSHRFFKGSWGAARRLNIFLLILGIFIPLATNVMYLFKIISFNATPVLLTISCVLFYFNTVKFNMLDILPLAVKLALQSIKEAFVLIDSQKNFIHANKAGMKLFPELSALRTGQPLLDVDNQLFDDIHKISQASISEPIPFEMAGNRHFVANISAISEKKGSPLLGYIILIQDVTETVLLTRKLEEMAHTDSLTGIFNRRQFMNLASKEIERTKRSEKSSFFVLFDIDYFKKINDTYGHLVGDRVLKSLTERVNAAIRPYDLFARYGGEEFILFVSDISKSEILNHTERIRKIICETPVEYPDLGVSFTVTSSFGVTAVTPDATIDEIIKAADDALYKAKADGRNKVIIADN